MIWEALEVLLGDNFVGGDVGFWGGGEAIDGVVIFSAAVRGG